MEKSAVQYYVLYDKGETGTWGAYLPELPGCVAVGETREEVRNLIRGAVEMHLAGMREDGLPIPEPSGELIEVA